MERFQVVAPRGDSAHKPYGSNLFATTVHTDCTVLGLKTYDLCALFALRRPKRAFCVHYAFGRDAAGGHPLD